MNERDRAELRRIKKQVDQASDQANEQRRAEEQLDAALSATQLGWDALSDQALEATDVRKRFRYVMGQVKASYSEELRKTMAKFAHIVNAATAAQVERMNRQVQDAFAAYDAQFVEMSRQIQRAVTAQMASVRIPRVEIFRPTLDRVIRQIEIPYHPPPTPAPVGGPETPSTQPSVPAPEQDLAQQIGVGVLISLVSTILASAILTYAQTGLWVFEELLAYFVQLIQQLD